MKNPPVLGFQEVVRAVKFADRPVVGLPGVSKLNRTNNFLESMNKEFAANVGHSKPTEILQYCVTGNVLFYMTNLCNDTVFYNLIVLSCYFSDFVILYS